MLRTVDQFGEFFRSVIANNAPVTLQDLNPRPDHLWRNFTF